MTSTILIVVLACVSQAHAQFQAVRRSNVGPAVRTVRAAAQSSQAFGGVPVNPATVAASAATAPVELQPNEQQPYDGAVMHPAHHWARSPVIPAPAEKSATKFDLVAFQGQTERSLFQRIVSRFSCPSVGGGRPSATWWSTQCKMETKVVQDKNMMPVIAMKGAVPCAAAAYTGPHTNGQNTFVLEMLIRNAEEKQCVGGGAAIMCHLIHNSKNDVGAFSPLRFTTNSYNEPSLKQWLRTFGCTTNSRSESGNMWSCQDRNPEPCDEFVGEGIEASGLQSLSIDLDETSRNVLSAPMVMMAGFLAASAITFRMLRLRNSASIEGKEVLLTA